MDRRGFLRQVAVSPFLIGLGELVAQEGDPEPNWLKTALEDLPRTGHDAVVVVLPTEVPARAVLGRALWKLLTAGGASAQAIFLEADFIFLSPSLASGRIARDAKVGDRFLLGSDGKVVARGTWDDRSFATPEAFAGSFGSFVGGEGMERLRARDEAARKGLSQETLDALGRLDHESAFVRDGASALLGRNLAPLVPCLVYRAATTRSAEEKARLRDLIEKRFKAVLGCWEIIDRLKNQPRSPLPYGIERSRALRGIGCGVPIVEEAPEGEPAPKIDWESAAAVRCGMGSVDDFTRTFVKFLSK